MSETNAIAYTDVPFHKKLKPELLSIASAMGVDAKTVPLLRKAIQDHMRAHPELADDPKFTPVFAHRAGAAVAGKTSADKASEEAAQVPITGDAITGANRTLFQRKVKTDPPGQFSRLSLNDKRGVPAASADEAEKDSDSESGGSEPGSDRESPSPAVQEKAKVKKQPAQQQVRVDLPELVRVNFFNSKDPQAEPRQVPVLSNEIPISTIATADGNTKFTTFLSKLLPVAFQNDSPIKDQGGRIYRPGIRGEASHHHIGKIDAILDGTSRPLKIGEVDTYTLRASPGGDLFCDVIWEHADGASLGANAEPTAVANAGNSGPTFLLPAEERPQFTGSGTDIPLAIATDRAVHNPTGRLAAPGVRDRFLRFLHGKLKDEIPALPDFGTAWPRAKYAGMVLDRHLLEEQVFEFFTAWSRPIGGYVVPQDYHDYAGIAFTKDEVLDTIKMKSSSSSNDHLIFSPENLIHWASAKAWYESGGKTNKDYFNKMTTANFKRKLRERRAGRTNHSSSDKVHVRVRRRSPSPSGDEGPSRKHRRSMSVSGEESEQEHHYEKKRSSKSSHKRSRAPKSVDSQNLDN